ncbi:MAG: DAK2 domain-containing protein [Dehalococcoidia bacterium]|nr:DAK2 domain-containing protein [Dehalococcoidia bacterium]
MTTPATPRDLLDGPALRALFMAASSHLRQSAAEIDAINVYPVPDGDTGTNMSATLREAVDRATETGDTPTVAEVLHAIARGALYGARGNSGVILSQALRGFESGVGPAARLDARGLADGLQAAATQAYHAVSKPQEGTMLTVLREAATEAMQAAETMPDRGSGLGCAPVMARAVLAAEAAEAATIDQLPALTEAGVTDAGGEGVCVILGGLFAALSGETPRSAIHRAHRPIAMVEGHGKDEFGFCTEFLIEARDNPLDLDRVRAMAEAGGNRSVVVVGDETLARLHVHCLDPQPLIDAASQFGTVSRVKAEDMGAQHERFKAGGSGAGARIAVLAMSRGEGFDAVFESLGAAVSDLGLVEKPPAGQIADAADALRIPDVVVLSNHKNVRLAAEQAASLAKCTLHLVPTASLPQGVAAAMAFDPDESAQANVAAMNEAAEGISTIEVTIAAASRTADGVDVREGQAIALLDGRLVAAEETPRPALLAGLRRAGPARGSLVTIYGGEDTPPAGLEAARAEVEAAFDGVEVEALSGGQPLYPFIASVE